MKEEISTLTTGGRRTALVKLWDEECERNEIISQKLWKEKKAPWFVKYKEIFRMKQKNKTLYIKTGENKRPVKKMTDPKRVHRWPQTLHVASTTTP